MAVILRGPRQNQTVKIVEIKGEFATVENGQHLRLAILKLSGIEKEVVLKHYVDTPTFHKYYDLEHFIDTGTFKRQHNPNWQGFRRRAFTTNNR